MDASGGWFDSEVEYAWWHLPVKKLLSFGRMPRHVAFIMDGNRRYARTHLYRRALDGHNKGFAQLTKILSWCRDLGITEVTVYAFSIENFKRSVEEVNDLMELFEKKLYRLIEEREKLAEKEIAIRFFGDLTYLPPKLRKLAAEIEISTSCFKGAKINVCIAYTAQDEIRRAFTYICHGIQKGLLKEDDISEYVISRCLDSRHSSDPDLLIRTSGEKRLSDFLLWQCSNCYVHFNDVLWPDFSFWNLCRAIFGYQYSYARIQELSDTCAEKMGDHSNKRIAEFLEWMEQFRMEKLRCMISSSD